MHSDEQQSPYNHPSQETTTPKAGYDAKDCHGIKIVFSIHPLYKENLERSYLRRDKLFVTFTTLTGKFAQIPLFYFLDDSSIINNTDFHIEKT
jgi:hypothetical protein